MKNAPETISTLAWTKADFENAGDEIPEKLIEDDIHTEGELMSREEVDEWLADTYQTFIVVHEQNPEAFDKLYDEFVVDVHYLLELGKIDSEEAAAILIKSNYTL